MPRFGDKKMSWSELLDIVEGGKVSEVRELREMSDLSKVKSE